jgi:precorrin-6Y C5,15-methyltransferase (decarboxylating)
LAVLLIHNPDCVNPWQTVRDEELVRGAVPMTKQAVRDISLAQLEVGPADTVYDIGAGTGAVAIALSRRASAGRVYAIEKNPVALELLTSNRQKLGAFNLQIVEGKAPSALASLPAPDRVFIGGSDGQIEAILDQVLAKNAAARMVVNAITLETLQRTIEAFRARQIEPEISCVNIAQAEKAGRYHLMKAQNPVYVISGGGRR